MSVLVGELLLGSAKSYLLCADGHVVMIECERHDDSSQRGSGSFANRASWCGRKQLIVRHFWPSLVAWSSPAALTIPTTPWAPEWRWTLAGSVNPSSFWHRSGVLIGCVRPQGRASMLLRIAHNKMTRGLTTTIAVKQRQPRFGRASANLMVQRGPRHFEILDLKPRLRLSSLRVLWSAGDFWVP